jgi:HlyD family secretion protein
MRQLQNGKLLDLADTSTMEVRSEVFESDIARIAIGQDAEITSSVLSAPLQGSVRWISPSIGRQTVLSDDPAANTDARVVTVRIALDDQSRKRAATLINHQVRVRFSDGRVAAAKAK